MSKSSKKKEAKPVESATAAMKKMFCTDDATEKRITELQNRFKLNRSDIARRGIEMLHDYLINDKLPANDPEPTFTDEETNRARSEGIQGFKEGKQMGANPYEPGSVLNEVWADGWMKAKAESEAEATVKV